jgi:energy-coupling factor transporter ATP-binding protein EcfA2
MHDVAWAGLGPINLVIGENGSGKTFLLKALYVAMRALEGFRRGADQSSLADILWQKLYWTFQPDRIGDLVTKGADAPLAFVMTLGEGEFSYQFGKDTTKQISQIASSVPRLDSNSVFLPAKEVLSLHSVILESREQDKAFGFDDSYLDLARALRVSPTRGRNFAEFAQSRASLEELLNGKVEYDTDGEKWYFRRGNQKFPIGVTSEGTKKIAILDTLLGNRYLSPESVIFIDEPESALHPVAISKLLDIIAVLARRGIQFFIASHSYFVVKKLFLIAQQEGMSIPIMSHAADAGWLAADLRDGMPDNPIIDESIRLYEQEVEVSLA